MYEIANTRLSDAVNFSNFSLEYTFIDEIEDFANCFVGKDKLATEMHFIVFPWCECFQMLWVKAMRIFTSVMNNVPIRDRTLKMFEYNPVKWMQHAVSFSVPSALYWTTAQTPTPRMDRV